jgi:hypothetical protein
MIYHLCFVSRHSETPVWSRPRDIIDLFGEEPTDATAYWCWGILRLSTAIYEEVIEVAYSSGTFAILESSTVLFPPGHDIWRYIRLVKFGRNAEDSTATSCCLDEHFQGLKSNCMRLERLDIFIGAGDLVQAFPPSYKVDFGTW